MEPIDTNPGGPLKRWPGANRPQLRILLFVLFAAACLTLVGAFTYYQSAVATATNTPTATHTIGVMHRHRLVYFSEAKWHRVRSLELSSIGLVILGLTVALCFLAPALLRSLRIRGRILFWETPRLDSQFPLWKGRRLFGWFGWFDILLLSIFGFVMALIVLWQLSHLFLGK